MAEPKVQITKEKSVEIDENKKTPNATVEQTTTVAPIKDETTEGGAVTEAPDAEDFSDVINLLNTLDTDIGGKGEISEIPDALRGSIKFLVDQLIFMRDVFEDPLFKAILDDLADQKQDGKTPSMMVAIARTIPGEKLQELADNEDYAGMQSELANELAMKKQAEEDEAAYMEGFEESQKAGESYAARMGYDESRKNELFQKVFDLFKIMGDGKLTEAEFEDIDKMLNYGPDTEALRAQIEQQDAKEMLPDQASIESAMQAPKKEMSRQNTNVPGLGSMGNMLETPEYAKPPRRFR